MCQVRRKTVIVIGRVAATGAVTVLTNEGRGATEMQTDHAAHPMLETLRRSVGTNGIATRIGQRMATEAAGVTMLPPLLPVVLLQLALVRSVIAEGATILRTPSLIALPLLLLLVARAEMIGEVIVLEDEI